MGHLHGTELQKGLPQGDPTEQHLPESPDDRTRHIQILHAFWFTSTVGVQLPVAQVAGPVFVCRAAGASTDAVHVLIAL